MTFFVKQNDLICCRAQGNILIAVGEDKMYRSSRLYKRNENDKFDDSFMVFQFTSPLYYVNLQRFEFTLSHFYFL